MGNEFNHSEKNNEHVHSRHRHFSVLPYITTPIIFLLISCVFVVPMMIGGMNFAVNTVHKAQQTLSKSYGDIQPVDDKFNAYQGKMETSSVSDFNAGEKIAELVCDNAGINVNVYAGINRVSLRQGVACAASKSSFGQDGIVEIYGNVNTYMKGLKNVKIGDTVIVSTLWGTYKYEVKQIKTASKMPEIDDSRESLVLVTANDSKAFSMYDDEKLCVVAQPITGIGAEEVSQ